jgi:hypothetical protein
VRPYTGRGTVRLTRDFLVRLSTGPAGLRETIYRPEGDFAIVTP